MPEPGLGTPFQPPVEPMLAKLSEGIPTGDEWLYEPKWDGFRTLAFFDGKQIYLQSRDSRPLNRYFPELVEGLPRALAGPCVLDGEVVVLTEQGIAFDALQLRLHPAESRARKLAAEIPASFVAFDMLADGDEDLRAAPLEERHRRLEAVMRGAEPPLLATPSTRDAALAADWFVRFEGAGFDGVIAKRLSERYQPGVRGWLKIKHLRSADCVVGGFRWAKDQEGTAVGSLLLGLYDAQGVMHHVGHTSSFKANEKRALVATLAPLLTEEDAGGFGHGRTPGTPSRWTRGREAEWVRVRPKLVCEVAFDHLQGNRFRHGTTFQRWRPDKPPEECTYDQLDVAIPAELLDLLKT
jgi:ATP-dependent DNA ligase